MLEMNKTEEGGGRVVHRVVVNHRDLYRGVAPALIRARGSLA